MAGLFSSACMLGGVITCEGLLKRPSDRISDSRSVAEGAERQGDASMGAPRPEAPMESRNK